MENMEHLEFLQNPSVQDIEDLNRNINIIDKPFGLIIDDNHEAIMDIIYKEFNENLIKDTMDCKKRIDSLKREIKLKTDLKIGFLNYYYDLGITNGKYNYDEKLKSFIKGNFVRNK
jgi:hypothetical protein